MNNKRIKDLCVDNRPDEKFLRFGAKALTDAELLAIILRTGTSEEHSVELCERILDPGNFKDNSILNIYKLEFNDLVKIKGIGKVKALQIKSLAELSLRISKSRASFHLQFTDPDTIAAYYMEQLRHNKREEVVLLMLDSSGNLIDEIELFEGTVNAALFSPREIYIEALRREAVNIILLHNHPSGNPTPSESDIYATERIYRTGKLVGIGLLDHIIIGDKQYVSMKKEGYFNGS